MLTDHPATMLGIKPGQLLTVELLEGSRAVEVVVAGGVSEYIGVSAYMRRDAQIACVKGTARLARSFGRCEVGSGIICPAEDDSGRGWISGPRPGVEEFL